MMPVYHLADLGEESVETVDLLTFLDVGIVLRDTLEGEFVHEVDDCWLNHVMILSVSLYPVLGCL